VVRKAISFLFYDESHYGKRVSSVALRVPTPYGQGALLYSIFHPKVFNTNRYLGRDSSGKNRDWVSPPIYKERGPALLVGDTGVG